MAINTKISETALMMASLRALSNYEPYEAVRTHDSYAEIFLPDDRKAALSTPGSREKIKKAVPKGLYEYLIARTKYFDEIFVHHLKNNFEQIVLLGAGFDSRPYRFEHLIKNTKIFEADATATQVHKLSILRKTRISIRHRNIIFVPINFETDDLIATLSQYGYDNSVKTLFLWEGVTFYLRSETVIGTLKTLRENSSAGSRICFDFQTMQTSSDLISTGLEDEVIKFAIEADKIASFVKDSGYSIVEHLTSMEMEKRFLTLQSGDLFGKIDSKMNFLLLEHD